MLEMGYIAQKIPIIDNFRKMGQFYKFFTNSLKVCMFSKQYAAFVQLVLSIFLCKICFLVLKKYLWKNTVVMEAINLMYFWLNYYGKNNNLGKITATVKNMDQLFCIASELLESDKLLLCLLSDGIRIDSSEYLGSLETVTELIVCTEEELHRFCIYFDAKRYLHSKNISFLVNINYFCNKVANKLLFGWLLQVEYNSLGMNKTGWLLFIKLLKLVLK